MAQAQRGRFLALRAKRSAGLVDGRGERYGRLVSLPLADSLVPPIIGLVGVVLGVVIGGSLEWWRERRGVKRRARAAARLLRADLFIVSRILRNGIARRRVPGFLDISLPSWRDQRDLLADALDADEWSVVAATCSRLQALAAVQELTPRWSPGRVKQEHIPLFDKALTEVVAAYEALGSLAHDPQRYDDALDLQP